MNMTKKTDEDTYGSLTDWLIKLLTSSHPWVYVDVPTTDQWGTLGVQILSPAHGADVTAWLLNT